MKHLAWLFLLGACANPDLGPTPPLNRNVISAGVGVGSVMTDCVDGRQRSTPGIGAGLILTGCLRPPAPTPHAHDRPHQRDRPVQPEARVGILSIGLGLAATVSNCNDWQLTGFGIGLGAVAAPCPVLRR